LMLSTVHDTRSRAVAAGPAYTKWMTGIVARYPATPSEAPTSARYVTLCTQAVKIPRQDLASGPRRRVGRPPPTRRPDPEFSLLPLALGCPPQAVLPSLPTQLGFGMTRSNLLLTVPEL